MRFVLIHGGFHGAWCWDRTIPELERLGHEAIAIDLPGHGERAHEEPTRAARQDALRSIMQSGDVLVGHSGGGFDITIAADAAPDLVSHVVYLAAGLPREGRTIPEAITQRDAPVAQAEALDEVSGMKQYLAVEGDGMRFADFGGARAIFYHDCDEASARWAFEQLTPARAGDNVSTPVSVPRFWSADLPRSFILCLEDRAQPRWLADLMAKRLGVEALTIDSSHSPFLSQPAALAELIVHATTTVPVGALIPD